MPRHSLTTDTTTYSVLQFHDGGPITDIGPLVNAAIDYIYYQSQDSAGTVTIPAGEYPLLTPIKFGQGRDASGITLRGAGCNAYSVAPTHGTQLNWLGTGYAIDMIDARRCTVEGITIHCRTDADPPPFSDPGNTWAVQDRNGIIVGSNVSSPLGQPGVINKFCVLKDIQIFQAWVGIEFGGRTDIQGYPLQFNPTGSQCDQPRAHNVTVTGIHPIILNSTNNDFLEMENFLVYAANMDAYGPNNDKKGAVACEIYSAGFVKIRDWIVNATYIPIYINTQNHWIIEIDGFNNEPAGIGDATDIETLVISEVGYVQIAPLHIKRAGINTIRIEGNSDGFQNAAHKPIHISDSALVSLRCDTSNANIQIENCQLYTNPLTVGSGIMVGPNSTVYVNNCYVPPDYPFYSSPLNSQIIVDGHEYSHYTTASGLVYQYDTADGNGNLTPTLQTTIASGEYINKKLMVSQVSYHGEDASTTWSASEGMLQDLADMTLVDSGSVPTLGNTANFNSPASEGVEFQAGQVYQCSDSSVGQIGTDDFILECVIRRGASLGRYIFAKRDDASDTGYYMTTNGSQVYTLLFNDGSTTLTMANLTDTAKASGDYTYIMVYGDRDEASTSGSRFYIDGRDSLGGSPGWDLTSFGSFDSDALLTFGARSDLTNKADSPGSVLYWRLYTGTDIFPGGVGVVAPTNTAIMSALAGQRYAYFKAGFIENLNKFDLTEGVVIESANGKRWRVTVNDSGALVTTEIIGTFG